MNFQSSLYSLWEKSFPTIFANYDEVLCNVLNLNLNNLMDAKIPEPEDPHSFFSSICAFPCRIDSANSKKKNKLLKDSYQKYYSLCQYDRLRIRYLFMLVYGILSLLLQIVHTKAYIIDIMLSIFFLIIVNFWALFTNIRKQQFFLKYWKYINLMLYMMLIFRTIHPLTHSLQVVNEHFVIRICKMIFFSCFPSIMFCLDFQLSLLINIIAYCWFIFCAVHMSMPTNVLLLILKTYAVAIFVFAFASYEHDLAFRVKFLAIMEKCPEIIQIKINKKKFTEFQQTDPSKLTHEQLRNIAKTALNIVLGNTVLSEYKKLALKVIKAMYTASTGKTMRNAKPNVAEVFGALKSITQWINRIENDIPDMRVDSTVHCFLGGSCNPTTWRKEIIIPLLEQNKVTYYNPQVDVWSEDLVQVEAVAKDNALILLFIIDSKTRALASIVEAAEYICTGRNVILSLSNMPENSIINNQLIDKDQLRDLNRARDYLSDIAKRHGVACFKTIIEAGQQVIKVMRHCEGIVEGSSRSGSVQYRRGAPFLGPGKVKNFIDRRRAASKFQKIINKRQQQTVSLVSPESSVLNPEQKEQKLTRVDPFRLNSIVKRDSHKREQSCPVSFLSMTANSSTSFQVSRAPNRKMYTKSVTWQNGLRRRS